MNTTEVELLQLAKDYYKATYNNIVYDVAKFPADKKYSIYVTDSEGEKFLLAKRVTLKECKIKIKEAGDMYYF